MTLLQGRQNVFADTLAHEGDESVEAAGDLLSLQDAEDGGDDRELVGRNLALLSEGGVEGLALRLEALEDGRHLGPRSWGVGGEEGVQDLHETSGEGRRFDQRAFRFARADGGGPFLDDGGG